MRNYRTFNLDVFIHVSDHSTCTHLFLYVTILIAGSAAFEQSPWQMANYDRFST